MKHDKMIKVFNEIWGWYKNSNSHYDNGFGEAVYEILEDFENNLIKDLKYENNEA